MSKIALWLFKVFQPVVEPILRWGLRFVFIGLLVWLIGYASFTRELRSMLAAGGAVVIADFADLLPAKKDPEVASPVIEARLRSCLREVESEHTSCYLGSWTNTSGLGGNSDKRRECDDRRRSQIVWCQDQSRR